MIAELKYLLTQFSIIEKSFLIVREINKANIHITCLQLITTNYQIKRKFIYVHKELSLQSRIEIESIYYINAISLWIHF